MADSPSHAPAHPHRPVPDWFKKLARFGLDLLRLFLPARWLGWLEHAAWFVFIGTVNTLIAYTLFVIFLNWFGLGRVPALMLAYVFGIVIGYHNFSRYVFGGGSWQAFLRFIPSQLLLYVCNQLLLEGLVRLSSWSEELSQFLLLPLIALLSYIFNRLLVFRAKS